MNAAVFLDRDNTLIHNDGDLGDPAKVRLMQGVASAVASLCGLGYKVVVITNQGGVARGRYTEADVDAVHERLSELLAAGANGAKIDRYYYCPYHPEGTVRQYRMEHPNRKPSPGMLQEAARDLGLDLSQSWTIGDQVRDVQAGLAAGTRAVLLRLDADRLKPFDPREHPGLKDLDGRPDEHKSTPDFYARNLVEAVRIVAQQRKPETAEQVHRSGQPQRKWDAAAVAKLQRERQKDRGEDGDEQSLNVESVPVGGGGELSAGAQPAPKPFRPWNVPIAEYDDQVDADQPESVPNEVIAAVAPARPIAAEPTRQVQAAAESHDEEEEKTLRLILQELRIQRGTGTDFSYTRIMAVVLQTIAGACLLGAFWLGSGDEALFVRLIGVAVVTQLSVIAAILWDR